MTSWGEHVSKWRECTKCPLCTQRFRICIARGVIPCDVLFIGEAPGASEDARGIVFDGPAGSLLDQIVSKAIDCDVVACAYTNLVCCFPRDAKMRGDNEPERAEILACRPRLIEFINIAQPKLIVCVGGLATSYVDHGDSVPCVDIVHPAYILAHMPAAQKGWAVQKAVRQVRTAVASALDSDKPFTEWGTRYAKVQTARELKSDYDSIDDVPF
jgi:uracil-DNA glycosylase family 4